MRSVGLSVALVLLMAGAAVGGEKIVISHRGASAYLPEHTIEAYTAAHIMGADYIEPDLVMTKDKRFICLHDIHLEATTNVEERFPDRKRDDGRWYAADFTLAEVKQLNVHERLNNRFPVGMSRFEVPTFEEMIELIQGLNATRGRDAGIYPELKNPAWHRGEGLAMEEPFLEVVGRYGYKGKDARIFVQCFEPKTLDMLRNELGSELPQILLLGSSSVKAGMASAESLAQAAKYADGIGPDKLSIEQDPDLVRRAHACGLAVHPYTLRADSLPSTYKTFDDELRQFYVTYDVDGLFTDFPDKAAAFLAGL
ncbi:MAG TPA: glycerophosphodiester phosphodiesterase family protein [Candidatus Hydrogenedentes bacterium]|nr:glycerophosphodiester phosphodiesterase family protein [Candidatus Hydrogenedentota bacterium]HPG69474.1 glycerophosphodiester phosphodiesterase family protein [Candidatus Hydrogenedentota bacterium]